ncbi:MAG: glucose-6-phosphate isomerase [Campylobacteraceae bacterium]
MFINNLYFEKHKFSKIKPFQDALFREYSDGKIGYYHLTKDYEELLNDIENYKKTFTCKKVVVIGVGGSSLGAKALSSMLYSKKEPNSAKLIFLENLDPVTISYNLNKIDFNDTLFLMISKSGLTIEMASITKIILDFFKINYESKEFQKHFAVVTDKGSPLEKFAQKYALKMFNIKKNVGGRFSVLSAVGLAPLMLCGYDVKKLLQGAKACEDEIFQNKNEDIFQKAYTYTTYNGLKTNVLFSYSNAFAKINEWYVQLWAESLGKKSGVKRIGLTPIGLVGSIDQHSFLQLIMDGPRDKSVTFLRVKNFENTLEIPTTSLPFLEECDLKQAINVGEFLNLQALSTMQSVIDEDILVDEIILDKLDELNAGYLIYYYEVLTSICGIMFNINAYNQPGVEVGKKILKGMLNK